METRQNYTHSPIISLNVLYCISWKSIVYKDSMWKEGKRSQKMELQEAQKRYEKKKMWKREALYDGKKIKTARNEMFIEKNMLLVRVALQ